MLLLYLLVKNRRLFNSCPIFTNYLGNFLTMNPVDFARIHICDLKKCRGIWISLTTYKCENFSYLIGFV